MNGLDVLLILGMLIMVSTIWMLILLCMYIVINKLRIIIFKNSYCATSTQELELNLWTSGNTITSLTDYSNIPAIWK